MKSMNFDFMKTEAFRLVFDFFEGNYAKTMLWFQTENKFMCGGLAPIQMVNAGRYDKLLKRIKGSLNQSIPNHGGDGLTINIQHKN